ncbi:MAG: hypothetical protein K2K26_12895 [Muribaculaceae bacterium]|nr:hypothetical protein [Muribaculaceae bacterium]
MRNFTLAMALAIGGLTMSGQVSSPASLTRDLTGGMMKHFERNNGENGETAHIRKAPIAPEAMPMREIAGPDAAGQIIDYIPEGEMKVFYKTGFYYAYNWLLGMLSGSLDGSVSRVVTSPDGSKMYIQNPVTYFSDGEDNWIVGDVSDDKVTFTFPQLISYFAYEYGEGNLIEFADYALKLEFIESEDGESGWYYPAENQDYTFRILADGTLEPTEPETMIGHCSWVEKEDTDSYWAWQGTGDLLSSMKELTDVAVEVPAEVEMETWNLILGISTRDVKIGVNGDKMYFAGSFTEMPEATVVGTIEDGKVTFDNGQYLGILWSDSSMVYFLTGYMEELEDENGTYNNFVITENMTFDYDAEKKILSCPEGTFLLSTVPNRAIYYSYTESPYICMPNPDAKVTKLLNPVIVNFLDYDEEEGYYPEIVFNFPIVDADKQPLDKSRLYYQVIVDGVPYEFYDSEYELPDGETMITDVPFGYNSSSLGFHASGVKHNVIIYSTGFDTLGIRTLYKGNSETIYSDIAWIDQYTKVNELSSAKDITAVHYYDLMGNAIVNPTNGIFIRQTKYTDGSVKAEKIVRR